MSDWNKQQEKDAFWDIGSLVPAQKKTRVHSAEKDTEAVEIRLPPDTLKGVAARDSLFVEHPVPLRGTKEMQKPEPLYRYSPANTLLREVRVYPWRTEYDYYDRFARHALQFCDRKGEECPQVEFFSYAPQYTQMNAAQLRYYFWWRENFRRGKCLPASPSYQLLYLYEIINLGEHIDPAQGQRDMLRLWLAYREEHPRLDALVREWIVDYSLLHRLPAPELPHSLYRKLLQGATLKEFFVPLRGQNDSLSTAMLLFCNNYDYTKSKFFTKESAEEYHRVLQGSVGVALDVIREREGDTLIGKNGAMTASRDAFVGAICSCRTRKRIEVEFTSFSNAHGLRYLISDVLKYAENAMRAARGIKSRLSIYAIDTALRERLDAYLKQVVPSRPSKKAVAKVEVPAYEKRYDLPARAPSLMRAAEIEEESWQTTKRLVEAFEAAETSQTTTNPPNGIDFSRESVPATPVLPSESPSVVSAEKTTESPLATALGELCEFVRLACEQGAAAQRAYALSKHRMPDAIVDEINTVSGDILGDIILEEGDDGYAVVEDYLEILREMGVLKNGE